MRPALRGPAARRDPSRYPADARRKWTGEPPTAAADPLARSPEVARVEAALFLADEPLTARKLAAAAGSDAPAARNHIDALRRLYDADGSPFTVEEIAGGFQLLTRPEYHPWLARAGEVNTDPGLSAAALETLTVVAYRQPVTRADVERVRGVQCGDVLHQLMERGLVRVVGRDDSLGRPALYGTAKGFLAAFGLNTLNDLPDAP